MNAFANLTGLAGIVISTAAVAVWMFRLMRIPQPYLTLLTLGVVVIVCIPIGALPPAGYVRAVTGDLSITSVVLLALALLRPFVNWQFFQSKEKPFLWGFIILLALALYPLALGIGYFDPYRLGFGNIWFLSALFVIAVAACWKKFYVITLCIALAVLAWSVGWNEANNLWNYLLDPFVAVYAAGALLCGVVTRKRRVR